MANLSLPSLRNPLLIVIVLGAGSLALWKFQGRTLPESAGPLHVPPGFEVERVAGPELISYPMMAAFDDRGRLFICESSGNTLNNAQMAANPDYRIRLLEDRDGDGRFDHSQVFADRLTLPAGAVWHGNSLYVASPPDLLRFEDTNGDGVADQREVVVTGWKMSSNAASLHGPVFGPDGWLYLTDGRHGFDIHTKDNRHYKGRASRIWRVRPDGTGLEWVSGGGFDNPVEVAFTPEGEMIGTMTYFKDPENGERDALMHFVEGGVYPKWYSVVDEFKRTGELMPVMTRFARIAPAGLMRYQGSGFGAGYAGNLFSAQFNPHRVQRHIMHREGASFRTEDTDFLTSTDPDFHPTDVLQDADGSLLVLDTGAWFIHGCPISRVAKPEIKGSIYRVRRTGAKRPEDPRGQRIDWPAQRPEELARLLVDKRIAVRDRAGEALVRAGDRAVPALEKVIDSDTGDEVRSAAVFLLYRIDVPAVRPVLRRALSDRAAGVRAAAARCLGMLGDRESVSRLAEMVQKEEPAVRRRAAASLGQIGDPQAVAALLAAAANPEDRFVEHSVIYSLITLNQPRLVADALLSSEPKLRKAALIALDQMDASTLRREQIAPFLRAPEEALRSAALWVVLHHPQWADVVLRYVSERLRHPSLPPEELPGLREALLAFGSNAAMQKLTGTLLLEKLPEERILFLLDAVESTPIKELPQPWLAALEQLLQHGSPAVQLRTTELARARAISQFNDRLRRIADDEQAPDPLRAAALGVLVTSNPKLTSNQFSFLRAKLGSTSDAVLRQTAAQVLGRSKPNKDELLELARKTLVEADPLVLSTVLESFRASNDAEVGEALIQVLQRSPSALGTLGETKLKTLLANYPAKVQEASGALLVQLRKVQEERAGRLEKLEPLLTAGGDAGRGRRVFFGEKAACASCHTIGIEGAKVGPDLTGIGSIRSGHDLLEAIVYPSASFVPGHEIYNVDTAVERFSGVLKSRSSAAVVLITGPKGEVRIPGNQIKSIEPSTVSLMPEGFDTSLTTHELTDLLAFLQQEKAR